MMKEPLILVTDIEEDKSPIQVVTSENCKVDMQQNSKEIGMHNVNSSNLPDSLYRLILACPLYNKNNIYINDILTDLSKLYNEENHDAYNILYHGDTLNSLPRAFITSNYISTLNLQSNETFPSLPIATTTTLQEFCLKLTLVTNETFIFQFPSHIQLWQFLKILKKELNEIYKRNTNTHIFYNNKSIFNFDDKNNIEGLINIFDNNNIIKIKYIFDISKHILILQKNNGNTNFSKCKILLTDIFEISHTYNYYKYLPFEMKMESNFGLLSKNIEQTKIKLLCALPNSTTHNTTTTTNSIITTLNRKKIENKINGIFFEIKDSRKKLQLLCDYVPFSNLLPSWEEIENGISLDKTTFEVNNDTQLHERVKLEVHLLYGANILSVIPAPPTSSPLLPTTTTNTSLITTANNITNTSIANTNTNIDDNCLLDNILLQYDFVYSNGQNKSEMSNTSTSTSIKRTLSTDFTITTFDPDWRIFKTNPSSTPTSTSTCGVLGTTLPANHPKGFQFSVMLADEYQWSEYLKISFIDKLTKVLIGYTLIPLLDFFSKRSITMSKNPRSSGNLSRIPHSLSDGVEKSYHFIPNQMLDIHHNVNNSKLVVALKAAKIPQTMSVILNTETSIRPVTVFNTLWPVQAVPVHMKLPLVKSPTSSNIETFYCTSTSDHFVLVLNTIKKSYSKSNSVTSLSATGSINGEDSHPATLDEQTLSAAVSSAPQSSEKRSGFPFVFLSANTTPTVTDKSPPNTFELQQQQNPRRLLTRSFSDKFRNSLRRRSPSSPGPILIASPPLNFEKYSSAPASVASSVNDSNSVISPSRNVTPRGSIHSAFSSIAQHTLLRGRSLDESYSCSETPSTAANSLSWRQKYQWENPSAILSVCKERAAFDSNILISWSQVLSIDLVTDSIISVLVNVHAYQYTTISEDFDPDDDTAVVDCYDDGTTLMEIFIYGCPGIDLYNILLQKYESYSYYNTIAALKMSINDSHRESKPLSSAQQNNIANIITTLNSQQMKIESLITFLNHQKLYEINKDNNNDSNEILSDLKIQRDFYIYCTLRYNLYVAAIYDILSTSSLLLLFPAMPDVSNSNSLYLDEFDRQVSPNSKEVVNVHDIIQEDIFKSKLMSVNAATLATQSKIKVDYYYEILYARIDVTAQRKHRDSQRISFITEFLNVYYGLILVELKKLYMISNGFTSSLHELPNVNESLMDDLPSVFILLYLYVGCNNRFNKILEVLSSSYSLSFSPLLTLGTAFNLTDIKLLFKNALNKTAETIVTEVVESWKLKNEDHRHLPWDVVNSGPNGSLRTVIPEEITSRLQTSFIEEGLDLTFIAADPMVEYPEDMNKQLTNAALLCYHKVLDQYFDALDSSYRSFSQFAAPSFMGSLSDESYRSDSYIYFFCGLANDTYRLQKDIIVTFHTYNTTATTTKTTSNNDKDMTQFQKAEKNLIQNQFKNICFDSLSVISAIVTQSFYSNYLKTYQHKWLEIANSISDNHSYRSSLEKLLYNIKLKCLSFSTHLEPYCTFYLEKLSYERVVLFYLLFIKNLSYVEFTAARKHTNMIIVDLTTILNFLEKNVTFGLSLNLNGSNNNIAVTSNTSARNDSNSNKAHIDSRFDFDEEQLTTGSHNIMLTATLSSASTTSSASPTSSSKNEPTFSGEKPAQYTSHSVSYFLLYHIIILLKDPLGSEMFLSTIHALYSYVENHRNECYEISKLMIAIFKLREDGGAYTVKDAASNTTYQSKSITELPIQAIQQLGTIGTTTATSDISQPILEEGIFYSESLLKQAFGKNCSNNSSLSSLTKSGYKTTTEAKVLHTRITTNKKATPVTSDPLLESTGNTDKSANTNFCIHASRYFCPVPK